MRALEITEVDILILKHEGGIDVFLFLTGEDV
jgi:hypothetical protein